MTPLPERWIGHAPPNIAYFSVILLHEVDHPLTNKLKACPFVCPKYITEITTQTNTEATIICLEKRGGKAGFQFVWATKYEVKFSDRKSPN